MRRRDVLLGALGLGGLTAFGGLGALATLARAGDHPDLKDRYFLFCYFSGGWDVLLSLDPRDPARFRADNRRETLIHPAYDLLDQPDLVPVDLGGGAMVGPFLGRLGQHADRFAILRGLSMETLTHEVGRRRFLTGKPPSGLRARGSSAATWMASLLGRDEPIPNLVGAVESYNVDQPSWASGLRVASAQDLVEALAPGPTALDPEQRDRVEVLLDTFRDCAHTRRSPTLSTAHDMHAAAQDLVDQRLDTLFDFSRRDPATEALRARYGFGPRDLRGYPALAAMAITALTGGVSRAVSISVTGGLDTHFDNWTTEQGPRQQQGFDLIATMIEDLASRPFKGSGDSWLDHTTIVAFSEFTRTPLVNASGGRDHALMNACLVAGAGVKPGIYGRSSDVGMAPVPVDLATGLEDPGGEIARPEHVLRALMADLGLSEDLADLRAEPYTAFLRG